MTDDVFEKWTAARRTPDGLRDRVMAEIERDTAGETPAPSLWGLRWVRVAVTILAVGVGLARIASVMAVFAVR